MVVVVGEVERLKRDNGVLVQREHVHVEESRKAMESERAKAELRFLTLQERNQVLSTPSSFLLPPSSLFLVPCSSSSLSLFLSRNPNPNP